MLHGTQSTNLLNQVMSNPNTDALMTILNRALLPPKSTAAGFKIVHIGVDRLPFSILDIASLSSKFWKKSTYFDSLPKAMRGHMGTLSIPDLVTAVST